MKTQNRVIAWALSVAGAFAIGYLIAGSPGSESTASGDDPALDEIRRLQSENESLKQALSTSYVAEDGRAASGEGIAPAAAITAEPGSALATAQGFLAGDRNQNAFLYAVDKLSAREAQALLEQAMNLPNSDPQKGFMLETLFAQLAQSEPQTALQMAASIDSLRVKEDVNRAILQSWAGHDPQGAISYVEANRDAIDGRAYGDQMAAIMRGYATSDPEGALAYAAGLPDENRGESFMKMRMYGEAIEAQLEAGNLTLASSAIENLPEGELRNRMLNNLVDEWAEFDPEGAADYVASMGDAVNERTKAQLVENWAEHDPAAAAEWIGALGPEDQAYERATAELIGQWARYDLAASAEWLNSQPASPELDRAIASFTFNAAGEDPAAALAWAETITDERMRGRITTGVAAAYYREDPEGFAVYAEEAGMSAEEQQQVQQASERWGGRGFGGGGGGPGGRGPGGR